MAIASYATKTNPSNATDYDRVAARDYARKYSCGTCTTSPHACRNTNYTFYNGADCANFVSQAIYAGGISQESRWKPGTITWINTGWSTEYYGLVEYMVDQGGIVKKDVVGKHTKSKYDEICRRRRA